MLRKLLDFLKEPEDTPETERMVMLAAGALLLEVAWADHDISEAELALIGRQLREQFGLTDEDVNGVIEEAREKHGDSVGVYNYTRTINDAWDEPRKFELILALWKLALSDDDLHRYEEHTIRRVAELLYVSHGRFIEAKLTARRDAADRS